MSDYNGISFERSMVKQGDVTDGTSHTYLIGERNIMPDHYQTGIAADDNSGLYTGYENDNYRSTLAPPVRDRPGMSQTCQFGSAHAAVWQMAYCDGAIHAITYEIDATTHLLQGDRGDGQVMSN